MVRTADYKYITYKDDPVAQLFDMKNDPWETKNLTGQSKYASVVADHCKILTDFEAPFDLAPVRQPIRPGKRRKPQPGKKT